MKKNVSFLCSVILVVAVAGCTPKQKVNYAYNPTASQGTQINSNVAVQVNDLRPFVLDDDKAPSYIGHFRTIYGNPVDVITSGKIALADVLERDLQKELTALGSASDKNTDKTLEVEILDYNFDAAINTRFWYEFKINVYNQQRQLIATDTVKNERTIAGSVMMGSLKSIKRQMPIFHGEIIQELVRDNSIIVNALN